MTATQKRATTAPPDLLTISAPAAPLINNHLPAMTHQPPSVAPITSAVCITRLPAMRCRRAFVHQPPRLKQCPNLFYKI